MNHPISFQGCRCVRIGEDELGYLKHLRIFIDVYNLALKAGNGFPILTAHPEL